MKLKFFTILGCSLACIFAFISLSSNNSGNPSTSCGGGSCHGNASLNTSINFISSPSLAAGYVANQSYVCTLAVSNTAVTISQAGFNTKSSIGTFSVPAGTTNISASGTTIGHNAKQVMVAGATAWVFNWTAPPTATANAIFTVTANCVNNNFQPSGDQWASQTYTFTPIAASLPPTVGNTASSNVTATSASITGIVNANGVNSPVTVSYGLTTSYGTTLATVPAIATGSSNTNVQANLTSLLPGTLYHYQLTASSGAGSSNSGDLTFTTLTGSSVSSLEEGGFKLYPNPSTNGIYTIENAKNLDLNVSVYDFSGRVIAATITKVGTNYYVNIGNMTTGNYVLRVASKGSTFAQIISK
jgi:Secretion system C-terminal sorting domain